MSDFGPRMERITLEFTRFPHFDLLPDIYKSLVIQARMVSETAYAPYSNYRVGAALLLENGEVITGNNQENASYPSGLCAERTALFHYGSLLPYTGKILALAIAAKPVASTEWQETCPCGACRQVMLEYENRQSQTYSILLQGKHQDYFILDKASDLLPFAFDAANLKK